MNILLKLGRWYEPWGKLAAISFIEGERYYFFVKDGCTSMIPACTITDAPLSAP